MKMNRFKLACTVVCLAFSSTIGAKEDVGVQMLKPSKSQLRALAEFCVPSGSKQDLDINNVRATILGGGDMWWDLDNGKYLVPKPAAGKNGPTALFAGSLWIGGIDEAGILKVAAMTYRQRGNDFWPGPLDASATTDAETCSAWDKHFKLNKEDVVTYVKWFKDGQQGTNPLSAEAMESITSWPTTGPAGQPIAPYYDSDGDGIYDPSQGDYPDFWLDAAIDPSRSGSACDVKLFGDQVLFWVFNDMGNIHTETGGQGIGLEVHAQAFAFQTGDAINDMTFNKYKVINKSSARLDSTFFGVWVDPDLGSASDDFVGCDVELGLGYCYNGDLVDDNPPSGQIPYGANPPAVGCDFFEGPFADTNGIDDDPNKVPGSYLFYGDSIPDNERIGMSKFVYYNNTNNIPTGNPNGALDVYRYLNGVWRDGNKMTYGGNGYQTGVPCNFMFPGTSDQKNHFGTAGVAQAPWDEYSVGNVPADRRFLQSAGPFKLAPGAVNTITIGLVWARAAQGGNLASVTLMKGADAKAQELFDRCFSLLRGPDAPSLSIQELDKELILTWTNPKTSNNYLERYKEDYKTSTSTDSLYRFQGYLVYQLYDATVTSVDLYDPDKARLILQCDIKDNVKKIINYTYDQELQALVPKLMVDGKDQGIVHQLRVTEDQFAKGNKALINQKTYYFGIIAYGYTPTLKANYEVPQDALPFISSNKFPDGFFNHVAIPHKITSEVDPAKYASGPKLTRVEGRGNGGNVIDLSESTVAEILASPNGRVVNPTYEPGRGPVKIQVIDPLSVPLNNQFQFKLLGKPSPAVPNDFKNFADMSSKWVLNNLTTGESVLSDTTIAILNEQIINGQETGLNSPEYFPGWGLSVSVGYAYAAADTAAQKKGLTVKHGYLESTMTFADPSKPWLTGLADEDGQTNFNWIRSGIISYADDPVYTDQVGLDNYQDYESVLNGTWAPYRLCSYFVPGATELKAGPAWEEYINQNKITNIASVDVVITSNKALWTRCPVIELQEDFNLAVGQARKMELRKSPSVDKNGVANYPSTDNDDFDTGMGWFPGYAINVETGERLNMAFGEDSWFKGDNGGDMIWNPTATRGPATEPILGGKHYIYIFGHNGELRLPGTDPLLPNALRNIPSYDKGATVRNLLNAFVTSGNKLYKRSVYNDAMWVNIPLLVNGRKLLETDVKIRLRTTSGYQKGYTTFGDSAATPVNGNYPMYTFNTSDIPRTVVDRDKDVTPAVAALDLINVVPNPYYANSKYEQRPLENIVKITNLPNDCKIAIYTLNGTLVRKFNKSDSNSYLDWDLKNQLRVPIASGMYIIHVEVPGVGEKILKWFAVLRPIDLDSY